MYYKDHNGHRRCTQRSEQNVRMDVFAKRLRTRARELGLSDAEVARRAGLTERRYGH